MADQTERSPKEDNFPSNSPIAGLRTAISAGNPVLASDMNALTDLVQEWIGHTHTYDDAYQLATFGNNGDRTDYYEDKTTGIVAWALTGSVTNLGNVGTSDLITADRHNKLARGCRVMIDHNHTLDDRESA